jgi:CelD/BcsL family acetyltransferase involved in cellulose biosynthesis
MTYWKHFGGDDHLFVLVVRDAGAVVAIAPLKLMHRRFLLAPVRHVEWIAAPESNYQDFVVGPNADAVLRCLLDYLTSHQHEWDFLRLTHLPETSPTVEHLTTRLDASLRRHTGPLQKCTYLQVDQTWEQFYQATKKARKKIAYRERRLKQLGEVQFFHCHDEDSLQSTLETFFEMHRERWDKTDTPSQFLDKRHREFYQDVSRQLLPKGQIDLFVLALEEKPVAMLYLFHYDQTCLVQLIAHDIQHHKTAPSMVVHERYVQEAFTDFSSSVDSIDFGHYYSYKEMWADRYKYRLDVEIFPRRALPAVVRFTSTIVTSLRELVSRNEHLRRFARIARRKILLAIRRP